MGKRPDAVNSEGSAGYIPDTIQSAMEESEDDAFCLALYAQYLADQDNGETVDFETAAQQWGVFIE